MKVCIHRRVGSAHGSLLDCVVHLDAAAAAASLSAARSSRIPCIYVPTAIQGWDGDMHDLPTASILHSALDHETSLACLEKSLA